MEEQTPADSWEEDRPATPTPIGGALKAGRANRFKWAMLTAIVLLGATVLVGLWLAFTAHAPTTIETDAASGDLLVKGPESDFVGTVDGRFEGHGIRIEGLPAYRDIARRGDALRAVCALRADPTAQWSDNSDTLRAHLTAPELDRICSEAAAS